MTDKASKRPAEDLVFVPLGGVGEIGMNLALYGLGQGKRRTWIAVDMGVSFANENLPGVDAILPDIGFLLANRKRLAGIVITHAHEDHYGALFDLWPELEAPVYMTPFAAALLEAKQAGETGAPNIPVTVVEQGGRRQVGPFEIEFVPVSHSIPEPNALAIRTSAGLVVHSGDWKLDPAPGVGLPTDEARFKALGEEGVGALVCDSTNAVRDGVSPSEADVAEMLTALIGKAGKRVIVTAFASNVARIRSVAEAAQKAGRTVVLVGRAMRRTADVAAGMGYLDGLPPFRDQDAFSDLPRDKVVALMTGSQGESRAALARAANGNNRDIKFAPGDQVIFSSRVIPGNERGVNGIINALVDQGVQVITDRDGLVHVSGHPRRDELRQMYRWLKPEILVPVHGEALHLHEHARLGRDEGIATVLEVRNGAVARLGPGRAEITGTVNAGRLYRDGKLLLAPEQCGVGRRNRLSYSGHVAVAVVLTDAGIVLEDPIVVLNGLPEIDGGGQTMQALVENRTDEALDALPKRRRRDPGLVRETLERAVRSAVDEVWGKRPIVSVLVTQVEDV